MRSPNTVSWRTLEQKQDANRCISLNKLSKEEARRGHNSSKVAKKSRLVICGIKLLVKRKLVVPKTLLYNLSKSGGKRQVEAPTWGIFVIRDEVEP